MSEQNPEKPAASGKGRATPSRKAQEAARVKPVVGNKDPEQRKAEKAKLVEERRIAREGMMRGEEKYLSARDKGPQKRLARDLVDSRFTVGELVMPALFVVILVSAVDDFTVQLVALVSMWVLFLAIAIDATLIARKVNKALIAKFGAAKVDRGVRWYAASRSIQMRALRIPKPQVKRGTKIK
jgi:hypothetical protein